MLCPTSSAEGSFRKELYPQSQTLIPSPWLTSLSPYCIRGHTRAPFPRRASCSGLIFKILRALRRPLRLFWQCARSSSSDEGSVPAETASKKSHRYPDGSSRSLPSHGSWIVGSPFYATSQACFCSAGGSAGCSPQRRVGPHSERCRNAGSGFSLSRTSSRGIPRTLQAHDPAHRLSDIFLLRFRNTRGRPWTREGRLLLVCKFVAQSLGQRSQSGNGP
jgi:hypothetical protein